MKSEVFFSQQWEVLGRALAFLGLPPLEPFDFPLDKNDLPPDGPGHQAAVGGLLRAVQPEALRVSRRRFRMVVQ